MEITHLLRNKIILFVFFTLSITVQAKANAFHGFGKTIDKYIHDTACHYQVSESMLRGLIKMEDGWQGKISPTGATGVGQFTMATWNWLAQTEEGKAIGMKIINKQNKGTINDPRRDNRINILAIGLLARWHIQQFPQRNIKPTDENLYFAHNIGLDTLHRALIGKSTADDLKNMRLNGMKKGMTVNQFLVYQKNRFNHHQYLANHNNINIHPVNNLYWVEPNMTLASNSYPLKWIEPTEIRWIEPDNQ